MRYALGFSLMILASAGVALPGHAADWRLGLQAGWNRTSFSGDTPPDTKFSANNGFLLGAVGDIRLSRDAWLSLQPMVQRRGTGTQVSVKGQDEPDPGPSLEFDYITVPVLLRVFADNQKTYVLGGMNVGFLTSSELVETDGTRSDVGSYFDGMDLFMDFGFGVMFSVRQALFNIELRYEQGLLDLVGNEGVEEDLGFPVRLRQSGFQFIAGVQWALGGK